MAPELLDGKEYDETIDIWSATVVIYILLSMTLPFDGKDDQEVSHNIKKADVKFKKAQWYNVSGNAKNFIMMGLRHDKFLRPSAQEMLNHPWLNDSCI